MFDDAERSARIEQICQRVEEECERRAREEELAEAQVASQVDANAVDMDLAHRAKRGSVSISRFGEPIQSSAIHAPTPSTPSSAAAFVVRKPTFYQVQMHTGSADSFASLQLSHASRSPPPIDEPDLASEQVVQMAKIAARGSLSISKAFSRARSRPAIIGPSVSQSLVIGVQVQEATVEVSEGAEDLARSRTEISAPYGRPRGMSGGVGGCGKGERGWLGRARSMTMKLRRRSVAALVQGSAR
ncbi:uncharacterized protein LAESUDRAFT_761512 [Laetiporus sulphureus 93-53]|uniref:Uncharacterized protein n=1 Tax=Laetiporus sulphureus 93-53 TaxID=1314785 RepID=A0A165D102_9APHY|nr:uncharacterized protein LAESUDRAFT_761512 [Laetiporus sulphureus 93-53]KZT03917.1 hypothetical protein LAESUDRAFT_761512 [Laetiporus sulphureus 93-53]